MKDQGTARTPSDPGPPACSWSYLDLSVQHENCLQQSYKVEGAGCRPRGRDTAYRMQKPHFNVHRAACMLLRGAECTVQNTQCGVEGSVGMGCRVLWEWLCGAGCGGCTVQRARYRGAGNTVWGAGCKGSLLTAPYPSHLPPPSSFPVTEPSSLPLSTRPP